MTSGGGGTAGAIEAGAAFVRLFTNTTGLEQGLQRARKLVANAASGFAKAGAVALGAGLGSLAAVVPAALSSLGDTAKLGAAADAFGLTAEEASRLFGVFRASGSDIRDATEGLVTLGQRVTDALEGKGGEATAFFDKLGVSAGQFQGLNVAGQFDLLLASLRNVEDPATRVQLLLKAVGEDTGKNLIPVLGKSADEVAELGRMFEVSAADMQAAKASTAAYTKATALVGRAWDQVAVALAPTVQMLSESVSRAVGPVTQFIKENRGLVVSAAAVAAGVAAAGAAFVGIGAALSGASALAGAVGTALAAVASPAGLVAGVLGGLGYLFVTQTDLGQQFGAGVGAAFTDLAGVATTAWGGITDAVGAGDLALAGEVAMAGLRAAMQTGVLHLQKLWAGFKGFFVDGFHDAVMLVRLAMTDLTAGIADALAGLGASIADALGEDLSSLLGLDGLRDGLADIRRTMDQDRQRERDGIIKAAQAAQAARDASRSADLAGAQAAVDAARAELDAVTKRAADAAKAAAPKALPAAVKPTKVAEMMARLDKQQGAFLGGADAAAVFGQGKNLAQQQLAAGRQTVGELQEANGSLKALLAKAGPLTFS